LQWDGGPWLDPDLDMMLDGTIVNLHSRSKTVTSAYSAFAIIRRISSGFKSLSEVNLSRVWAPPPVKLVALSTILTFELIVVDAQ